MTAHLKIVYSNGLPSNIEESLYIFLSFSCVFGCNSRCTNGQKYSPTSPFCGNSLRWKNREFEVNQKGFVGSNNIKSTFVVYSINVQNGVLPIIVFPVPGGPNSIIPFGGLLGPVNKSGRKAGQTTASCRGGVKFSNTLFLQVSGDRLLIKSAVQYCYYYIRNSFSQGHSIKVALNNSMIMQKFVN